MSNHLVFNFDICNITYRLYTVITRLYTMVNNLFTIINHFYIIVSNLYIIINKLFIKKNIFVNNFKNRYEKRKPKIGYFVESPIFHVV